MTSDPTRKIPEKQTSEVSKAEGHARAGKRYFAFLLVFFAFAIGSYTLLRIHLLNTERESRDENDVGQDASEENGFFSSLTERMRPPKPLGRLASLDSQGIAKIISAEDIAWYVGIGDSERLLSELSNRNQRIRGEIEKTEAQLATLTKLFGPTPYIRTLSDEISQGWTPQDFEVKTNTRHEAKGKNSQPPHLTFSDSFNCLDEYLNAKREGFDALKKSLSQFSESIRTFSGSLASLKSQSSNSFKAPEISHPEATVPSLKTVPASSADLAGVSIALKNLQERASHVIESFASLEAVLIEGQLDEANVKAIRELIEGIHKVLDAAREKKEPLTETFKNEVVLEYLRELSYILNDIDHSIVFQSEKALPKVGGRKGKLALDDRRVAGSSYFLLIAREARSDWNALADDIQKEIERIHAFSLALPAQGIGEQSCSCEKGEKCDRLHVDSVDFAEALKSLENVGTSIKTLEKSVFESGVLSSNPDEEFVGFMPKLRGLLSSLRIKFEEDATPIDALNNLYYAQSIDSLPTLSNAAGAVFEIQTSLLNWRRLYGEQLATIERLRPPFKFSIFLITPTGLLVDMFFWAILGVLANLLLKSSDYLRTGQFKGDEIYVGVGKLAYGPLFAVVLGLSISLGLINLGDYQIRVWVLPLVAFLFGFSTRKTARLINRLADKVLGSADKSLEKGFAEVQQKLLQDVKRQKIESVSEMSESIKIAAKLELAEILRRKFWNTESNK